MLCLWACWFLRVCSSLFTTTKPDPVAASAFYSSSLSSFVHCVSLHFFAALGLMLRCPSLARNFISYTLYHNDWVCFYVSCLSSELISWQMCVLWSTCFGCDNTHHSLRNKNGNADQNWLRTESGGLLLWMWWWTFRLYKNRVFLGWLSNC